MLKKVTDVSVKIQKMKLNKAGKFHILVNKCCHFVSFEILKIRDIRFVDKSIYNIGCKFRKRSFVSLTSQQIITREGCRNQRWPNNVTSNWIELTFHTPRVLLFVVTSH